MKLSERITTFKDPCELKCHIKSKINGLFEQKYDTFQQEDEDYQRQSVVPIQQPYLSNNISQNKNDELSISYIPEQQDEFQQQLFQSATVLEEKFKTMQQYNSNEDQIKLSYNIVLDYIRVVDGLKDEIVKQNNIQQNIEIENQALRKSINRLTKEKCSQTKLIFEQNQEIEYLKEKIQELQKNNYGMKEQLNKSEQFKSDNLTSLTKKLESACHVIKQQNDQIDELKSSFNKIQLENNQLKQISKENKEMIVFQQTMIHDQNQIKNQEYPLQQKITLLEEKLAFQLNLNQNLSSQNEKLKKQLSLNKTVKITKDIHPIQSLKLSIQNKENSNNNNSYSQQRQKKNLKKSSVLEESHNINQSSYMTFLDKTNYHDQTILENNQTLKISNSYIPYDV